MKLYFLFLLICLPVWLSAQATQFVVESFQMDLNDLEANRNPVFDVNDKKCALIKVRTDLGNITFSSNNGIVEQKMVLTEYWIYVSFDEKKLNIYKEGFIPLNYEIPVSLEESKVYTLYITSNKRFSIVIQTEPKDAIVRLDNNLIQEPNIKNISPGRHVVKIERDGYLPVNDTIDVSDGHIFFSYSMEKKELELVTITSEPDGAAIIVDNEYKGFTPKQLFMFPGKYNIQISKEFYQGIKEEITVQGNIQNDFNYILRSSVSYIDIKSYPVEAVALLDGKALLGKTKIDAGEHFIEVKSDLYYPQKRLVDIPQGVDTLIIMSLQPILGNLQFTVNPINTYIELYYREQLYKNWTGAKRLEKLLIGDYTLIADAPKFKKVEKQITIKENETLELFIDFAQEQRLGRKGGMKAFALSAILPGLGQYYSGHNFKSVVYSLSCIGMGAMTLGYNSKFNKTYEEYQQAKVAYNNAVSLTEIEQNRKEMYDSYDDLQQINKSRQIFFVSFAALYGLNLFDAYFLGKVKERKISGLEKNKSNLNIEPVHFYGGLGMQIRYSF